MQFYQVNYIFFRNFAFKKTYSSSDHYVRFSSESGIQIRQKTHNYEYNSNKQN